MRKLISGKIASENFSREEEEENEREIWPPFSNKSFWNSIDVTFVGWWAYVYTEKRLILF